MYQAKSGRCRCLDQTWGRTAFSGRKGHFGGSGTCTHRTKKEKKDMSHFEKFTTEGNEKADELAKEGALLDKWFCGGSKSENYVG